MKPIVKVVLFFAAGAAFLAALGTYQSHKNPPTAAQLEEARATVNVKK